MVIIIMIFSKVIKNVKIKKKSSIIVANTIKGKGFKILENNPKYSHQTPSISILNSLI